MGGGGSKSLEKRRAKEFAASDDDDDDDPERTDMHISRSLYKILNGNLATVKLPKPSAPLCSVLTPSCFGASRVWTWNGMPPRETDPGRRTPLKMRNKERTDGRGPFFFMLADRCDGKTMMIQTDARSRWKTISAGREGPLCPGKSVQVVP
jgi:hypothetical protein